MPNRSKSGDLPDTGAGTPTVDKLFTPTAPAGQRFEMRPDIGIDTFTPESTSSTAPLGYRQSLPKPVGGFASENPCTPAITTPVFERSESQIVILKNMPFDSPFITCGWQENETVTTAMQYPDGSLDSKLVTVQADGSVIVDFYPTYGALLGDHILTIGGTSGTLGHRFNVLAPEKPGILKVEQGEEHLLYLFRFQPDEKAQVLGYRIRDEIIELMAWREVTLDSQGELKLLDEIRADLYVAIAERSGEAWSDPLWSVLLFNQLSSSAGTNCPGVMPSRLDPGGVARVTLGGTPNNLRQQPSTNSVIMGLVSPGDRLQVLGDPPVCRDGFQWWRVQVEKNGYEGWVAEGSAFEYWLEPLGY